MKINKILTIMTMLFGLFGIISAQETKNSAEKDFENYERGLIQTPTPNKSKQQSKPSKSKKQPRNQPQNSQKAKTVLLNKKQNTGLPGMKIWLERQKECGGAFLQVAPTAVFNTGDCVRARFRLNFEGYLTIINLGTSGAKEVIFPLNGMSNLIAPKSDNYLPDNKGWEFEGDPGDEQLFFIVSNAPLDKNYLNNFSSSRSLITSDSPDIEIYDRDLKPRTEKDSVYVLADENRLKEAIIFRLTLKHR